MRTLVLGLLISAFSFNFAMAADAEDNCHGPHCKPKTKEVCFNVVCSFNDHEQPKGYENCRAASTFNKRVTLGGGEVEDDSAQKDNPQLEVKCDNGIIFNNSARRFTDLLGTRIQGETGPYPSLILPRGALHSGANGTSGSHVANAVLQLDTGTKLINARGLCHIWTGAP